MKNCTFVVNKKGRLKVLLEKRKNVHAFVRGEVLSANRHRRINDIPVDELDEWDEVSYNPYQYNKFYMKCKSFGVIYPVYGAEEVLIINNKVYAKKLQLGVSFK